MSRGFVVKDGKSLPELTNPAVVRHIRSGFQAIGQDGAIITGTLSGTLITTVRVKINNKHYNDDICVTDTYSATTIRNGGSATLSLYRGVPTRWNIVASTAHRRS